jgi:hypothetical protein
MRRPLALAALSLAAAACSGGITIAPPPACDLAGQTGCAAGLSCEPVGAGAACFAPVLVRGTVVSMVDPAAPTSLSGARVVALDSSRSPVSTVATSGAGAWELAVRAARDASGKPIAASVTLRADAQDHQTFPGGIRPALPIDLSTATLVSGRWILSGPLTALQLLPLLGAGTGRIAGTVTRVAGVAAPLVVAEPQGVSGVPVATAIAGADGAYVLFNLAAGVPYVVTPYAKGARWTPSAPTQPGAPAVVDFGAPAATAATVTGGVIFDTGATPSADVELVIESTYNGTLDRGESPPGLTLHVTGNQDYAFAGVPDGHYRVLAAYGIDGDVRDQSSTGNATPPTVTVAGGASTTASASFKITPAVPLVSIGGVPAGQAPVLVVTTATPTFAWTNQGASNANIFRVHVFDAFGNELWPPQDVTGAADMSIAYAGAPLVAGQYYQLRIVAIKTTGGFDIQSQTEDLLGVFTYRP